jgi:signal transduction histidine kinase/FixJ family two-component response regulator
MRQYLKIYLSFLSLAVAAILSGFYYSYNQQILLSKKNFEDKYDRLTSVYADQIKEIELFHEKLMKNALYGIEKEIKSKNISTDRLREIAKKYNLTHLFLIENDGNFLKSTNEDPSNIPNLYSFSTDYKNLIHNSEHLYLTTPIILPFPEKTPHKFLTVWRNGYFIEVGVRIQEIAKNISSVLERDHNILQADFVIGEERYTVKAPISIKPETTLNSVKRINIKNPQYTQSAKTQEHEYSLIFHISENELHQTKASITKRYLSNLALSILLLIAILFFVVFVLKRMLQKLTGRIFELAEKGDTQENLKDFTRNKQIANLIKAINKLLKEYRESTDEAVANEREKAFYSMAMQVAHDIRSPLEALKSSKDEIAKLPEIDRQNVNLAISRIEEIAYQLLQKRKKTNDSDLRATNIRTSLDLIIQEKLIQYRSYTDLKLNLHTTSESLAYFSKINSDTFKCILSNIISNAAEASEFNGDIDIYLASTNNEVSLEIHDYGIGISEASIDKLFTKGFTTKKLGNGLGLYHAKKEIDAIGGTISLTTGHHTIVTITLPKEPAPSYFAKHINLNGIKKVIILDDDLSIHQIWKKKFQKINVVLEHYYSGTALIQAHKNIDEATLLLSDYELLGDNLNGIDTILKLNAHRQSIIVTARSDEESLIKQCEENGITILPKIFANEIPLTNLALNKEVILIDDDKLVHLNWKRSFQDHGVKLNSFYNVDEFLNQSSHFELNTPIYIDSNLGNGLKGEIESEKIYLKGFTNLTIATGYDPEFIHRPNWIKNINSKSVHELRF